MQAIRFDIVLADFMDFAEVAAPIIFMILYGVAQLVSAKPAQAGRKPAAPRPRPAPDAIDAAPRPANPAGAPPTLEETLRREVEDFLRRAQGQPVKPSPVKQRPAERRPAPQEQVRRLVPQAPPRERPGRRQLEPVRPAPIATVPPPVAPPAQAPLGSGVAQHVAQHLSGTTALGAHAQHLGADVAQADERMQTHLRDRFVHQVGTLSQQSAAPERREAVVSAAAKDLYALLAKPGGMRQVIVAGEILRRPEERW